MSDQKTDQKSAKASETKESPISVPFDFSLLPLEGAFCVIGPRASGKTQLIKRVCYDMVQQSRILTRFVCVSDELFKTITPGTYNSADAKTIISVIPESKSQQLFDEFDTRQILFKPLTQDQPIWRFVFEEVQPKQLLNRDLIFNCRECGTQLWMTTQSVSQIPHRMRNLFDWVFVSLAASSSELADVQKWCCLFISLPELVQITQKHAKTHRFLAINNRSKKSYIW